MLTPSLNTVMTRLLIVAAVLATLIIIIAPRISSAQEASMVVDYAENGTDAVITFTSTDPEGSGIDWDVTGPDADDFVIDERGVLMFNESPNSESPTDRARDLDGDSDSCDYYYTATDGTETLDELALGADGVCAAVNAANYATVTRSERAGDNRYEITVRATEQETEGADVRALSTETHVTIVVTDKEEPGSVTMNRIQPEVGTEITAMLTDPDGDEVVTGTVGTAPDAVTLQWTWYVSKVTNPVEDVESHWIEVGTQPTDRTGTSNVYTPVVERVAPGSTATAMDEGKYLRAVVTYLDMGNTAAPETSTGLVRTQIGVSLNPVRAEVSSELDTGITNPENGSPGFSSAGVYTRSLPENTAVGMPVGAPVTAIDPNSDTLTYERRDIDEDTTTADVCDGDTCGDAAHFSIDAATGQLTVADTLDYDGNMNGYKFYVRAIDPSGETADVMVTVTTTDTNDAPTIMGSSTTTPDMPPVAASELRVYEQDADGNYTGAPDMLLLGLAGSGLGNPNVFTAPDEDARGQIFWTLTGTDADDFDLSQSSDTPNPTGPTGLSGPDEPIALRFKTAPDYENPTDSNMDSVYEVTLVATDSSGASDSRDVTVFVDQVNEQGKVVLDEDQPLIGQPITAMVEDPDNGVAIVTWRWERATSSAPVAPATWEVIPGATTDTYTPVGVDDKKTDRNENDNGFYLRATATYTDITSTEDDLNSTGRDERTQKDDGTNTLARVADTGDGSADDSDKVYRQMETSKNAVRVNPTPGVTVDAPQFAMSSFDRAVVENAEYGSIVGDPVRVVPELDSDGDPKTTFSYDLTATISGDDDYFYIDTATGQIRVRSVDFPDPVPSEVTENCEETAAEDDIKTCPDMVDPTLDYEGTNTFSLIVTAEDENNSSRTAVATVNVSLENLNEEPYFDRATREAVETTIEYGEQRTNAIVQLSAVEPDGHSLKWEVTGDDAPDFMIVDADDLSDGKDRVHLMFAIDPDFENGKGSDSSGVETGTDNDLYTVMVRATEITAVGDGPKMAAEQMVTVRVTNAKEAGTVGFTLLQPEVGTLITASVTDLDGVVDETTATDAGWQWYRAKVANPNRTPDPEDLSSEWLEITGATNAAYTPQGVNSELDTPTTVRMDEDLYLLAKVVYSDPQSPSPATTTAVGITTYATRANVTNAKNNSPDFNASTATREIPEDTAVGMPVGDPVAVIRNEDGDVLTYEIVMVNVAGGTAADANVPGDPGNDSVVAGDLRFFSIDEATGQLRVKETLSAEMTDRRTYDDGDDATTDPVAGKYTVVVRATDPSGDPNNQNRDDIVVTVTATNVNEAPTVMGLAELAVNEADSSDDDSYAGLEYRLNPDNSSEYLQPGDPITYATSTDTASTTTDNLYHRSEQDVVDRAIWPEPIAGPDGALFEYSTPEDGIGRRLHFKSAPDFENPLDADGDNVYEVTITVNDAHGAMGEKAVRITVMNVDEEGTLTLSPDQPDDGMPVIATLADPDGVIQITNWKWFENDSRDDATRSEIEDATMSEYTGDVGEFLWAMVEYRDGASVVDDVVTVLDERNASSTTTGTAPDADDYDSDRMLETGTDNAVQADPDPPTDPDAPATGVEMLTRMVYENVPSTGYAGDPIEGLGDRDKIGGPDGAAFEFAERKDATADAYYDASLQGPTVGTVTDVDDKMGQLALVPVTHLDHETKDTYIVEITDPDSSVDISTYRITFMVLDVNEAPTAPSELRGPPPNLNSEPMFLDANGDVATSTTRSVAENTAAGTAIGDAVAATDSDRGDQETVVYTLGGADAASFTIDSATGQLSTSAPLDFETKSEFMVAVTATDDDEASSMIYVTIMVTDEGLATPYDMNEDGTIDSDEAVSVVADYFAGDIDAATVTAVVTLYFAGL